MEAKLKVSSHFSTDVDKFIRQIEEQGATKACIFPLLEMVRTHLISYNTATSSKERFVAFVKISHGVVYIGTFYPALDVGSFFRPDWAAMQSHGRAEMQRASAEARTSAGRSLYPGETEQPPAALPRDSDDNMEVSRDFFTNIRAHVNLLSQERGLNRDVKKILQGLRVVLPTDASIATSSEKRCAITATAAAITGFKLRDPSKAESLFLSIELESDRNTIGMLVGHDLISAMEESMDNIRATGFIATMTRTAVSSPPVLPKNRERPSTAARRRPDPLSKLNWTSSATPFGK